MKSIQIQHREVRNWSDWVALAMARVLRWGMDTATGYKHPAEGEKFGMTEKHWMNRILFLESVAGVPGMVAGMLRHLRSLRTMKRDNGWYFLLFFSFFFLPNSIYIYREREGFMLTTQD
jgi:hypothetical protein